MLSRYLHHFLTVSGYSLVLAALIFGWLQREQRYLVAETGMGYWLGIAGGSMMLMLLIYPLRKRNPRWQILGSVKFWFRLHMLLGISGPVLVIFHSGFRLGSLNGRVAFFSMLIVAMSGLIGRYLYRRIHHGLYGEKIRFEELFQSDNRWIENLSVNDKNVIELVSDLKTFEQKLTNSHTGINRSYWFYRSTRNKLKQLRKKLNRQVSDQKTRQYLIEKIVSLRSICQLGIHEVLFSYWHVLHFPLFIMLVISGLTHVLVVHFY